MHSVDCTIINNNFMKDYSEISMYVVHKVDLSLCSCWFGGGARCKLAFSLHKWCPYQSTPSMSSLSTAKVLGYNCFNCARKSLPACQTRNNLISGHCSME